MLKTDRINHPALVGSDGQAVIRFYTEVLGMEMVLRQPNLDFPTLEHLFFQLTEGTSEQTEEAATAPPPSVAAAS